MLTRLHLVRYPAEIRGSLTNFNRDATTPIYRNHAEALARQTIYWVYDPVRNAFGPNKFVAYRNMTLARYIGAKQGYRQGARFDGYVARVRIERVMSKSYAPDGSLQALLVAWAGSLLGSGVFSGVVSGRWQFVSL